MTQSLRAPRWGLLLLSAAPAAAWAAALAHPEPPAPAQKRLELSDLIPSSFSLEYMDLDLDAHDGLPIPIDRPFRFESKDVGTLAQLLQVKPGWKASLRAEAKDADKAGRGLVLACRGYQLRLLEAKANLDNSSVYGRVQNELGTALKVRGQVSKAQRRLIEAQIVSSLKKDEQKDLEELCKAEEAKLEKLLSMMAGDAVFFERAYRAIDDARRDITKTVEAGAKRQPKKRTGKRDVDRVLDVFGKVKGTNDVIRQWDKIYTQVKHLRNLRHTCKARAESLEDRLREWKEMATEFEGVLETQKEIESKRAAAQLAVRPPSIASTPLDSAYSGHEGLPPTHNERLKVPRVEPSLPTYLDIELRWGEVGDRSINRAGRAFVLALQGYRWHLEQAKRTLDGCAVYRAVRAERRALREQNRSLNNEEVEELIVLWLSEEARGTFLETIRAADIHLRNANAAMEEDLYFRQAKMGAINDHWKKLPPDSATRERAQLQAACCGRFRKYTAVRTQALQWRLRGYAAQLGQELGAEVQR